MANNQNRNQGNQGSQNLGNQGGQQGSSNTNRSGSDQTKQHMGSGSDQSRKMGAGSSEQAGSQDRRVDPSHEEFIQRGAGLARVGVAAQDHRDSAVGVKDLAGQRAHVERFKS